VSLPSIAAQEAERVRETVRAETEQMLDASARTLATLQMRVSGKRPPPATAAAAQEEPAPAEPSNESSMADSLPGMAKRITGGKRRSEERSERSERPKGGYELSDVLAAAEARESLKSPLKPGSAAAEARETAKSAMKPGAAAAFGALQSALADLAGELNDL